MSAQNTMLLHYGDVTIQYSETDKVYVASNSTTSVPVALENYCMLPAPTNNEQLNLWQLAYRVITLFRNTININPLSC
jgi:hypothetical protein